MNLMSGQQQVSPDAEQKNPTGQWLGSNSSVRKLLLLIYKGDIYWGKNIAIERLLWLSLKSYVQTISPFAQVMKRCIQLRLKLWLQCLKNQLQNSKLKQKHKLLKCKCPVNISTLNFRTLNRISQLPELTSFVSGRPGFNPRSRHTKDFKNGTWYLLA